MSDYLSTGGNLRSRHRYMVGGTKSNNTQIVASGYLGGKRGTVSSEGGGVAEAADPSTIESYDPVSNSWEVIGNLPVSSYVGDAGVIEKQGLFRSGFFLCRSLFGQIVCLGFVPHPSGGFQWKFQFQYHPDQTGWHFLGDGPQ